MFSRELTQEVEYPPTLPPMLSSIDFDSVQEKRLPFMHLEAQIVRASMAEPNVLTEEQVGWLRYMVSLARCVWIRAEDDGYLRRTDTVSVSLVCEVIRTCVESTFSDARFALRITKTDPRTQRVREVLLEQTDLDQGL